MWTPGKVADWIGIPPEHIRNLRVQGHLKDIGTKKPNGHWAYTEAELGLLSSARHLSDAAELDMASAIRVMKVIKEF